MDSGNTNNLNNENVNPNLNNTNEDLTNIFDTPVDLEVTNLGVGETINEYSNENTEILSLDEISEFKEAEIKVESLDINDIRDSVETNPFELNNLEKENADFVQTNEVLSNTAEDSYAPSSVDNLNPVDLDSLTNNQNSTEIKPEETELNKIQETGVTEQIIANQEETNAQIDAVVQQEAPVTEINNEATNEQPVMNTEESVAQQEVPTSNFDSGINTVPTNEQPAMNTEINDNQMEVVTKKKKNFLPIIIVLCVLGVLGGLVAAYFLIFTSPKNIFNKAMDSGVKYLGNSFVDFGKYDTITGNGSLSYEIKAEDANMQATLDMINGISLNYEYGIDYKNKLMNLNLDSKYNNEKLLDLDLYTENNKAYLLFVELYNSYIVSPIEGYDTLFNTDINQEEINIILNSFSSALSKALTDEDFVKSEETIKINGEEVKTTKNSLVLNNKNINRIVKSILTTLKDDADFISAVNKISNDDSVDTKSVLEDAIKNIGEVSSVDNTVIAFSIYTKGLIKEAVGFSCEIKSIETIKMFINKNNDSTYSFVVNKGSEELVNGNIKTNVVKTNTSNSSDVELAVNVKTIGSLKLNVKNNTSYNSAFNKPDISNNIAVEQLPLNWSTNIATLAMANPGFVKLMTNIQTLNAQKEAEAQQDALNNMQQFGDVQNQIQNFDTNTNFTVDSNLGY